MTALKKDPTDTDATASEMNQGPAYDSFNNFIKTKDNTWSPGKHR